MSALKTSTRELQRRVEDGAIIEGIRRSKKKSEAARRAGREAYTAEGMAFARRVLREVLPLFRNELTAGKRTTLDVLRKMPADRVCIVACQAALQRMSRGEEKFARACERIGRAVEDIARPVRSRKVRWSQQVAIKVGSRFMDYLTGIGIFEEVSIRVPPRKGKRLRPARGVALTADALADVQALAAFLVAARPVNPPCVIEPSPWKKASGGGYHFRSIPLIRRASEEQLRQVERATIGGELRGVYAALNSLQSVPWRINARVFDVAAKLIAEGRGPAQVWAPLVAPSKLLARQRRSKEKAAEYRAKHREVESRNKAMRSKFVGQELAMAVAAANRGHSRIYFPFNLDSRGRVYPLVDFLSPHGNDLQRGLLEFAKGDRMGGDAARWLAVHLANTYGKDKVSFDARVQWAFDHRGMIRAVAADPMTCDTWHKADKPWQFLAACFAWSDFQETGESAVCRVPVMLDGSCSAFQHYGAALRDEGIAAHVNLIEAEAPGDLYGIVTRHVKTIVEAATSKELAVWRGRIDRSIVKRAVMVEPYGASHLSKLKYIREQLEEEGDEEDAEELGRLFGDDDDKFEALSALTSAVRAGTKEVAPGPLIAMGWIRGLVRAWAKQAPTTPFSWTAPTGLPVVTAYYRSETDKEVEAKLGGSTIYIGTQRPTKETNWTNTETAAAPNFIHSLDASHLILSVGRAASAGVRQLCAVHDAFGTTPRHTGKLLGILRDEFAKLYASDQFARLTDAATNAGVSYDKAGLRRGKLDPESIRKATYLFA